jgi:hypothetical protein
VADFAVGADRLFGSLAHPDDARPEQNLNAHDPQSCLRTAQVTGEVPADFWGQPGLALALVTVSRPAKRYNRGDEHERKWQE